MEKEITLCPICDQPIKGYWCSNCKHIIREPVRRKVRESAVPLEEREGIAVGRAVQEPLEPETARNEADSEQDDCRHRIQEPVCQEVQESADPLEAREPLSAEQAIQEPPEPEMPGDEADRKQDNQSEAERTKSTMESQPIDEKNSVSVGKIIAIVAAILVGINIISSTISVNSDPMSGYPFEDGNSFWYDGMFVAPDKEPENWDQQTILTQAEVMEQYDSHCNTEGHMSLLGVEAVAVIREYLTGLGYQVEVARQDDAYNQVYSYQGLQESTYFFVSDYISAYPVRDDGIRDDTISYTAFIESDTVTGEVHRLTLYFPNLEDGCQLIGRLYLANGDTTEAAQADLEQVKIDLQELLQDPAILRDVWNRAGESLQLSIEDYGDEYYAVLMPCQE